jgi:hemerythrin
MARGYMSVQWNESLSVGIDEIDHQHRLFLDYFNLLIDAINSGGRWSDVHFSFVLLRDYAKRHFFLEESVLRMSDYPGTDEHIECHRKILEQLDVLEKESLNKNISGEATALLQYWLLGHIMHTDIDYARHFAEGGKIVVRNPARQTESNP